MGREHRQMGDRKIRCPETGRGDRTAEEAGRLEPSKVRATKVFYEGVYADFPANAAAAGLHKLMDRILQLQGGKLNGLPSPVQGRNAIGRQECLGPAALICPGTLGGMSFRWNWGSSSSSSAMVPKEGADSPWTIGTT